MPQSRLLTFLVALFVVGLLLWEPVLPALSATERLLLLTAHPDDECFFFGPTLLALASQKAKVYSLTVSNGNYDGLGTVRTFELLDSLSVLGVLPENSFIIDHPQLQDNFTQAWDEELLATVITPYIVEHGITTILTFDQHGISSHPNHYSLYYGARKLIDSWQSTTSAPPRLFVLHTTILPLKYTGWLTPITSKLFDLSGSLLSTVPDAQWEGKYFPRRVVSGVRSYVTAFKAMDQHQSQMLWFRWLYILFSRYMWQNDWIEIKPTGAEEVHVQPGAARPVLEL